MSEISFNDFPVEAFGEVDYWYTCSRCGAVVRDSGTDTHRAWHERLTTSMQAVAKVAVHAFDATEPLP